MSQKCFRAGALLVSISVFAAGLGSRPKHATLAPSELVGPERLVLDDAYPPGRAEFEIGPGGRLYFPSGTAYFVYSPDGAFEARLPTAGKAEGLVPLASGGFVSAQSGGSGRLALLREDGTESRALVKRGPTEQSLHRDTTGWTTPTRVAIDQRLGWLFALDTTAARDEAAPEFSRVAIFDMHGKWVHSLLKFDGVDDADPSLRTWYDDIEVDPERRRVLVTARASQQLRAYDYQGRLLANVPGVSGVAIFRDGRVAVGGPDRQHIAIYDPSFRLVQRLDCENERDLEVDARGRLLASVSDETILVERFETNSSHVERLFAHYARLVVQAVPARTSDDPLSLAARVTGYPVLPPGELQAWARPGDGSSTAWQRLDARYADGRLTVKPDASLRGPRELRIRWGTGAVPVTDSKKDLFVSMETIFGRVATRPVLALSSRSSRSAFVQGETIRLRLLGTATEPLMDGLALRRVDSPKDELLLPAPASPYFELTPDLTRRLVPGRYELAPRRAEVETVPWYFDLGQEEADSPLQRVLYQEFEQHPATSVQPGEDERGARVAFVSAYLEQLKALGFNRETDRAGLKLLNATPGRLQSADVSARDVADGYFTPVGGRWEPDVYLDRATSLGIAYDTQLLAHCATVPMAPARLTELEGGMKRLGQWLGKYPAFYGFNVNDELFFDNAPFVDMPEDDRAWLAKYLHEHPGASRPDAYRAALERLYSALGRAARLALPRASLTATPMWQYPAVEGSYAPSAFRYLTESYSHYLSEGYDWPFYAPHSVDLLRRPGLPLIGVFDNGFKTADGEVYLKNALLVLSRGVQGVGVSHTKPFQDAAAASALRTANRLARDWGPVFARATPDNEGVILYSYAQDVTEKRRVFGTPHWERVFAAHGAALMAHVPMGIVYEEDVAAGVLLDGSKLRVPLLFLAGQTARLSEPVTKAIERFRQRGGRVVSDSSSAPLPGVERLELALDGPLAGAPETLDGDALFPGSQPAYLALADALHAQLASRRRLAADASDRWTALGRFRSGELMYLLAASETGPYPLNAKQVWGLGASYNRSYQPKVTRIAFPESAAVYDAFEQRLVATSSSGDGRSTIDVDLRNFPGRLYALAPRKLPAPRLRLRPSSEGVEYRLDVGVRGGVPVRVRLKSGEATVTELFRLTQPDGTLRGRFGRPVLGHDYRVEAAELLSGQAVGAALEPGPLAAAGVRDTSSVELESPETLSQLLASRAPVQIALSDASSATSLGVRRLRRWLESHGRKVSLSTSAVPAMNDGLIVEVAIRGRAGPGELHRVAQRRGAGLALAADEPGPGRALVTPALALRQASEDALLISAGDENALNDAVRTLLESAQDKSAPGEGTPAGEGEVLGVPMTASDTWRLSDHVGARLAEIRAVGSRVAVSAHGLLGNAALVADDGGGARVIDAARVGDGPMTSSLFLSRDGKAWGLAARSVQRFGEGFYLRRIGTSNAEVFASFGDLGATLHRFGVDAEAKTVVAPGPHGVVAWRCTSAGPCAEAWSDDAYRGFDGLDWPVGADAERQPSFDIVVPPRGQVALITYGELSDNGWIKGESTSRVSVTARALGDGHVVWSFAPDLNGQLAFPKLYSSDDAKLVLLELQLGSWKARRYAFYLIKSGKLLTRWTASHPAASVALSNEQVLVASTARGVELRGGDGELRYSRIWPAQPVSTALDVASRSVFLADDAGHLTRLDAEGERAWEVDLQTNAALASSDGRLYAAGWDGRLRGFEFSGVLRFSLDLTPTLKTTTPSAAAPRVYTAKRPLQTSPSVPAGPNLLRNGGASLSVGGTAGWKSRGVVQVGREILTNGKRDDAKVPWLAPQELYWAGIAGRQVWAQIDFTRPTDVSSLTVYEDPAFPDSFPTESQVEVWIAREKRWKTVKHAVMLAGAINTYSLELKQVSRMRYVPWGNYFRNFHTSEIEVR